MHKLDTIRIEGFKSIKSLGDEPLQLEQLNVLIGANGSGKSNFLSAFRMLRRIMAGQLRSYVAESGGAANVLHFGPKQTSAMLLSLNFHDVSYCCQLAPTTNGELYFVEEYVWSRTSEKAQPQEHSLGEGHRETQLKQRANAGFGPVTRAVSDRLDSCKVYHFQDTSPTARVRMSSYINDNEALHEDGGNLPAFLYLLQQQHPSHYDLIVKNIRRVAPFFDDFVLKPLVQQPKSVQLDWREIGSEEVFPPSALSDGTLRFICLVTLLLQPALPATVLIDEPELGLHPFGLSLLAGLIRSAANTSQILVTTQSVDLLNEFEPEQVIVTERAGGSSIFRRLNPRELKRWLKDYSLGELWQKNVIGGGPQA